LRTGRKKKARIEVEKSQEVERILQAAQRGGGGDIEALENALKPAVLAAGAQVLEQLLEARGTGQRGSAPRCACGTAMQSRGVRGKRVFTLLGPADYRRSMFQCPQCAATHYPGDAALGIEGTSRSPGLRRQVARLGAKEPFEQVSEDLAELAGVALCRKEAERIAEHTGAQMEQWRQHHYSALRLQQPPPPPSAQNH